MCGFLPMSPLKCWKTGYQIKKTISYAGCLVQCFFFIALVHVEIFILAAMAFDRYMAIGNPLLYGSKMSRVVCIRLITFPYIYGFLTSLAATLWTYGLFFCGKIEINHFYRADPPLIKMACAGTFVKEYTMIILAGIKFTYSLTVIIISYYSSSLPLCECTQQKEGRRPFPHVGPIWQLSLYSMVLWSSCISDVPQRSLWSRGRWWLCSIPRWSPCWIPWSTVGGTRTWKRPWWKWSADHVKQNKIKFDLILSSIICLEKVYYPVPRNIKIKIFCGLKRKIKVVQIEKIWGGMIHFCWCEYGD